MTGKGYIVVCMGQPHAGIFHEHRSKDVAVAEAKRLALHDSMGRKFVVYEAVALVRRPEPVEVIDLKKEDIPF